MRTVESGARLWDGWNWRRKRRRKRTWRNFIKVDMLFDLHEKNFEVN